jgi:hypothetical protein
MTYFMKFKTKEKLIKYLEKNRPKIFSDDSPDIVHGVNCHCSDSCLEFYCDVCKCSWSSGKVDNCYKCGAWVSPS